MLKIINRYQLTKAFNQENYTTHPASMYTGCYVDGDALVFKHTNGVGSFRLQVEKDNEGCFSRLVGYEETCSWVRAL